MTASWKRKPRLLAAALVTALLFAACGDGGSPKGKPATGLGGKLTNVAMPQVDPNAPFPALSTNVFDALAADVPELAKHREAALSAERDAIKGAIANMRAKSKATKKADNRLAPLIGWIFNLIPEAMADGIAMATLESNVLGHAFGTLFGGAGDEDTSKGGGSKTVPMPGEGGKVEAAFTVSAEKDGLVTAEMTTKVDIPLLFLEANSKVTFTGSFCPNPDGKVEFTIKAASNGHAGSAGSVIYDQNVEARVVATVGEDANMVNADIDTKQGTRSTRGGRQVYVETSRSAQVSGGESSRTKFGDLKEIRTSSQARPTDVDIAADGLNRAYALAGGALQAAQSHWQRGNCIKILATSPGRVKPGATSTIPVAVKHKKDGASVPAKVTVALAGGKSVAPAVIPTAPGEVTHVAPSDRKSGMTITLTANSRRGRDKMELNLTTGQAFFAEGGLQDFHGTGTICDIAAPFTIEGGGNVVSFVPTSEKGGTYTYAGNMSGFGVFGNGTYTVAYEGEVPVGITATGPGSVKTPNATHTKVDTEKYTLVAAGAGTCTGSN